MIISHRHRFIFVKTAKTAGTSIEILLSELCEESAVVTPFFRPEPDHRPRNHRGEFHLLPELVLKARIGMAKSAYRQSWRQHRARARYHHHMPAWQIRLRDPREWQEYRTFCVERDPWDKVLSGWHWMRDSREVDMSLDAYLDHLRRHVKGRLPAAGLSPYNLPNYTDPFTGEVMVDDILRFDDLEDGLRRLLDEVGLPAGDRPLPRAKDGGRSAAEVLTPSQVEQVGELFRPEIELHGFRAPT